MNMLKEVVEELKANGYRIISIEKWEEDENTLTIFVDPPENL